MKEVWSHLLFKSLLAVCLAVGMGFFIMFVLRIKTISVAPDYRFSDAVSRVVKERVPLLYRNGVSADGVVCELSRDIPALSWCSMRCGQPYSLFIRCQAHDPRLKVGNSWLLLDNGTLVPGTQFSFERLPELKTIAINQSELVQEERRAVCARCLVGLPDALLMAYDIDWHSPTEIVLTAHDKDLVIIAHTQVLGDHERDEKIKQAERIQVMKNGGIKADIRFKDTIVCTRSKGDRK